MPDRGTSIRPRAELAAIEPYVAGRQPAERELRALRLASNENPLGPSPLAAAAAMAALSDAHRYPDRAATRLKAALAERHGLATDHFAVGNGSDDLIYLLAEVYLEAGRTVVIADPPYSLHRIAAQTRGAALVPIPLVEHRHDLDAMARATAGGGWVVVTNPHNPTGTAVPPAALRRFLEGLPDDVLAIVDEAYFEFAEDGLRWSAIELVPDRPNVIVLRTFSKVYGLAGLRVGYAVGTPALIEPVERIRPPFNVSVVAQAAAAAALRDEAHLARTLDCVRTSRRALLAACRRLDLEAIPSQANFVLLRARGGWPATLAAAGVIVRPGENLGMPGWARVSLGTPEETGRVIALLEAALGA